MKPHHQSIVTLESRASSNKQGKTIKSSPVLILSACAAVIGGVGYYVQQSLPGVEAYKPATHQTTPQVDRPAAVGHMIWESATRLIISAQQ